MRHRDPARIQRVNLAWGACAVVGLACLVTLLFWRPALFQGGYEIRAAFRTTNNLQLGSPVRISGVKVGKVQDIDAGPDGRGSVVKLHIDEGVELRRDLRLKIRPRIFLEGNYFVDVQPGSPSAPPLEGPGAVVPVQQTATPVQLNQVLTALQSDSRKDVQVVLDELGRGLDGAGARGFNGSMRFWEDAYRDTALANEAFLGEADDDVEKFIDTAGTVAAALDRSPPALEGFVRDLAITANALAREDDALSAAITELPRTFDEGTRAMAALEGALPALRRLVADLRPTVRSGKPAVEQGGRLLAQAKELMGPDELGRLAPRLQTTARPLARLTRSSTPLNAQLRALSNCQVAVVGPYSEDKISDARFPTEHKVYQEAFTWLPGIAGESRGLDANGQYVKVAVNGANYAYALRPGEFFLTGSPLQGVNPGPAPAPALEPDEPCEDQEQPDLRSNPVAPPKAIKINHSSKAAIARRGKAQRRAVKWLRADLDRLGLGGKIPVLTKELEREQLPLLRRQSAQLRKGR